jgi:hypothetical protein
MLNNMYKKINYDTNISSFEYFEEKDMIKNHNIFIKIK